ncbi:thermonuclease family protein [Candidatus Poriferisocius sp.]|uniref:thermonuclease family protein n=1 Tax=Candidatus Poriferisocius sp. TaxID=3101276 RepID=UPI003B018DE5
MKPQTATSNKVRAPLWGTGGLLACGLLACWMLAAGGCSPSSSGLASQSADSNEAAAGPAGAAAIVKEVVDGDTVVLEVAGRTERVRLIGIDTPEATGGFLPAECYGDEASAFTKSLLPPGTGVYLTRDTEARDRYNRLLAYVYRAGDGLFVNLDIAARGYGEALVIEPNTIYAEAFHAAAAAARGQGLGLWGACGSADVALQ